MPEYGLFECPDCPCVFVTDVDLESHKESGQHDRLGDRYAEQNMKKFKYSSRRRRLKEELYEIESRKQNQSQL